MKTIIFIGGDTSDIASTSIPDSLINLLTKNYKVISPPCNFLKPKKVHEDIEELYFSLSEADRKDTIFIGYSMGALFASYFSRAHNKKNILINPIITPSEQMKNIYDDVSCNVYRKMEEYYSILHKRPTVLVIYGKNNLFLTDADILKVDNSMLYVLPMGHEIDDKFSVEIEAAITILINDTEV